MAYIKFKEVTRYFNFNEEMNPNHLPKYVIDYLGEDEEIYAAFKTKRDKAIFTSDRMILFDNLLFQKAVHIIPYKSIATSGIIYGKTKVTILLSLYNSYPVRLNFVRLDARGKTRLRLLYIHIMNENKK